MTSDPAGRLRENGMNPRDNIGPMPVNEPVLSYAPGTAERVGVTYVRAGKTEHVRAKRVVLSCYNMVVPYLCPELPKPQR